MKTNKGFTLIELLVVISIIGILSGFLILSMNGAINSANDAKRKSDINTIRKSLLVYKTLNGSYPVATCRVDSACTNLQNALVPTYLAALPSDPNTGSAYSYTSTDGTDFTVGATLSNSTGYSYTASTGQGTVGGSSTPSYASTCVAASNAQVQCSKTDISSTEEVCSCTYLSGAGTTSWTVPAGITSVQYLIVGGGGGGSLDGYYPGGAGGGAGGLLQGSSLAVSGTVPITVGTGGASFTNGTNSVFGSLTAIGGGHGGNRVGGTGGSGGGSVWGNAVGSGTSGQGNAGGMGLSGANNSGSGGGGGAGAVGGAGGNGVGGAGGIGLQSSITGTATYYAGGGGGWATGGSGGAGGLGGGGAGGNTGAAGTNGLGGGGGGSQYSTPGGTGGSGIVIFRLTH